MSRIFNDTLVRSELTVSYIRRFAVEDMLGRLTAIRNPLERYLPEMNVLPSNSSTPPDQPRFILASNKKQMLVSSVSIELQLTFGSNAPSGGLLPAMVRAAEHMHHLDNVLSHQAQVYCGLIISQVFTASQAEIERASRPSLARVFNNPPSNMKFANFTISQEDGSFLHNFELSRIKQITMDEVKPGSRVHVDLDFDYSGAQDALQIKLDVNDKAGDLKPRDQPFTALIERMQRYSVEVGDRYFDSPAVEGL